MTIKLFPRTVDGDQLCIEFDYQEEATAFTAALHELGRMRDALVEKRSTEEFDFEARKFPNLVHTATLKKDVKLLTTLQVEVLRHRRDIAAQILGVHVCNIFGRNSIHMSVFVKE